MNVLGKVRRVRCRIIGGKCPRPFDASSSKQRVGIEENHVRAIADCQYWSVSRETDRDRGFIPVREGVDAFPAVS